MLPPEDSAGRWSVVVGLGALSGCPPFTVSNTLEFCAILIVPFCLGFLISKWWSAMLTKISLALVLLLFGSLVRLLSSSIHDGSNWFALLVRSVGAVGIGDPYVRHVLLTLVFPVLVCGVATVMFMSFQRRGHANDA
jgi:hypothetical protein